jgi:diguanylate cyclase (GGDEF)-like protein/PAS domain S-box-containing protein
MAAKNNSDFTGQTELKLQLSQFAMDNASIEIYWFGSDARIYYANNQACKTLGYSKEEFLQLSLPDIDPNFPIDQWHKHWQSLKHDKTQSFETLHKRKDGVLFPVEVIANYVSYEGYEFNVGFAKDITERKLAEDVLSEKEEFFRMISENVDEYVAVIDLEGRRLYNNPSYANLFGGVDALKGSDSFAEIHPDDRERVKQLFHKTVQTGIGHRTEFRFVLGNGSVHHMESSGALIKNGKGEALRLIVVSRDITERKQAEEIIHNLAFNDSLTKLPNRRLLNDRLEQIIVSSKRSALFSALLFLDLDNFKALNDEYGHDAGDILLVETASRLRNCVREMDTVARFGGDEFIVMLSELDEDKAESSLQAALVAEKIRAALADPYLIQIHHEGKTYEPIEYHCTSSIGVVLFTHQDGSADEIIKRADKAMYQAKAHGGNQFHFFESNV